MKNIREFGAAMVVASGLLLAAAGTASAAEVAVAPVASSGSGSALGGLFDSLATGSSDTGSSVSGGVKVGNNDVAGTPLATGSSGTGSSALCATNPTTNGCPK
ncbi:hypothetical protein [Nocardia sp. XZ_19_369]|uniref:hypothetical protein n=1 Tax=Nocardia sp. XZ_19_369 TaxID=2769487 RepID=UPI0018906E31|nr:hypothetical protein [Nocardia sp. XZ_19_369]